MRSFAVFCVASVLLFKNAASQVVKMDSDQFVSEVPKNHHFIMFYAPWCGHCSRLKPTWEELATNMQSDSNRKVNIAQIDCTVETELCSTQDVTGYPTLKLFVKGSNEPVRYRGSRDLASLLSFINENLGVKLDTENEILQDDKVAADRLEGAIELTEENFKEKILLGDHFVKFYAPWCGHCQKLVPTWDALAKTVDSAVTIGKVDCTQHRTLCNEFDVKGYPTLLWINKDNGKSVEKYHGSRSLEDLKSFVDRMMGNNKEDSKEQATKDEKAPAAVSSVVVLTESNFEASIESGIAFVKFFAPWCGHCKRLAPTWEELGAKFAGNAAIKIAKVDCTDGTNRQLCANQEVKGFPTIFLYSNGVKLEEYDGNRSLDDMLSFVNKNNKQQGKDEL